MLVRIHPPDQHSPLSTLFNMHLFQPDMQTPGLQHVHQLGDGWLPGAALGYHMGHVLRCPFGLYVHSTDANLLPHQDLGPTCLRRDGLLPMLRLDSSSSGVTARK